MLTEDALDVRENQTDGLSPSFDWLNRCGLKPGELHDSALQPGDEVTIRIERPSLWQAVRGAFVFGCFAVAAAWAIAAAVHDGSRLSICLAFLCTGAVIEKVK